MTRVAVGGALAPAEAPRPRARPSRLPADNRAARNRFAGSWRVGTSEPANSTYLGRQILSALRRGTPVGVIASILAPSELGDGSATDEALRQVERDYERWQNENSSAPTVTPSVRDLTRTRSGAIEFYPPEAPDPFTPLRRPIELPQVDIDTVPPIPRELPSPLPAQASPKPTPSAAPGRSPRPRLRRNLRARPATDTALELSVRPDGKVRLRQRQRTQWSRRRRDSKLKRWYVVALRAIDRSYGVYDEASQLSEAIAWNTYDAKGNLAMNLEGRSQLAVYQGIGRGEYEVDFVGALAQHSINQAMDWAIGVGSRYAYHGNHRLVGLQSGPWDNNRQVEAYNSYMNGEI